MEKPHKRLEAWKKSMAFIKEIYLAADQLPDYEKFGLATQIRRSATSIPSNIAEGAARKNKKEFIQFIYFALGSCSELDTHLEICHKLGYISDERFKSLDLKLEEIDCILIGLRNSLLKQLLLTPYSLLLTPNS